MRNDMLKYLPNGSDLKRWQKLLTELQMLLHAHPVNTARVQRGARPINSSWLDQIAPASAMPHDALNTAPPMPDSTPTLSFAHSLADIAAAFKPFAQQVQDGQTASLILLYRHAERHTDGGGASFHLHTVRPVAKNPRSLR